MFRVDISWPLDAEIGNEPVSGPRPDEQLEDDVGALGVELTDAEIDRVEPPMTPV